MRLRRRKRNNWLREKTIARINEEHNGLFEKEKESLFHKFISYLLGKKGWWIVIMFISLCLILISSINIEFLNIIDIKYETAKELVNQRTSDLAAIFSIALVVVGFLLSSLAIKHSISYKLLFKNAKIYLVVYYCLSLIAALIVLSSLRDTIDNVIFTKVFLGISYCALIGLFLIGKLFRNIIGMTSEDSIYESIGKEYLDNYVCELKENMLREKSKEIFKEEMEKFGLDIKLNENWNEEFFFDPLRKTNKSLEKNIYNLNIKLLKSEILKLTESKNNLIYNPYLFINSNLEKKSKIVMLSDDERKNIIAKKIIKFNKNKRSKTILINEFLNDFICNSSKNNDINLLEKLLLNYYKVYNIDADYEIKDIMYHKDIFINIRKCALNGIKNNNIEILETVTRFRSKVMSIFLEKDILRYYKQYLNLPIFIYNDYVKSKDLKIISANVDIYDNLFSEYKEIISETICYLANFSFESKSKYYIKAYEQFIRLISIIVVNKDLLAFKKIISIYKNTYEFSNLFLRDENERHKGILEKLIFIYNEGLYGIKFWLYYLFIEDVLDKRMLIDLLDCYEKELHCCDNPIKHFEPSLKEYTSILKIQEWEYFLQDNPEKMKNINYKYFLVCGIVMEYFRNMNIEISNKDLKAELQDQISLINVMREIIEYISEKVEKDSSFIEIFKLRNIKIFEWKKTELRKCLEEMESIIKKNTVS